MTTIEGMRTELETALHEEKLPDDLAALIQFYMSLGASSRARCAAMTRQAKTEMAERRQHRTYPRKQRTALLEAERVLDEWFDEATRGIMESAPPEATALFFLRCHRERDQACQRETSP